MTDKPDLSTDNQIISYLHCRQCVVEVMEGKTGTAGESPESYSRYSVGWTPRGLQVWCNRHDYNVCNIDFEGAQHPALTTRDN
jgi:hypothetical protein